MIVPYLKKAISLLKNWVGSIGYKKIDSTVCYLSVDLKVNLAIL